MLASKKAISALKTVTRIRSDRGVALGSDYGVQRLAGMRLGEDHGSR